MSVRIKTEDGDLIVSGKGKDGKDGKDGGGDLEWLYLDTSKQALQFGKLDDSTHFFPVISSIAYTNDSGNYVITGGTLTVLTSGSTRYLTIKGTVRNIEVSTSKPLSGEPTVFTFTNGKFILGIPKPCVEQFGISVVNR